MQATEDRQGFGEMNHFETIFSWKGFDALLKRHLVLFERDVSQTT